MATFAAAVDETAHELPLWFDAGAMAFCAVFGAAIARSRDVPVFATLLAGMLTGLGGGAIRDMLLGVEPEAISNPAYIPAGLVGALIGALFFSRVAHMPRSLLLFQSFAMGALVTVGAQKGLQFDVPVLSAITLGVVAPTFGGVATDLLTGERPVISLHAHWFTAAMAIGSVVFVAVSLSVGFWPAVVVSVATSVSLRYLSLVRDWPSPSWPGQDRTPQAT